MKYVSVSGTAYSPSHRASSQYGRTRADSVRAGAAGAPALEAADAEAGAPFLTWECECE